MSLSHVPRASLLLSVFARCVPSLHLLLLLLLLLWPPLSSTLAFFPLLAPCQKRSHCDAMMTVDDPLWVRKDPRRARRTGGLKIDGERCAARDPRRNRARAATAT